MADRTTLYHATLAPVGRQFADKTESLIELEAQGWVDNPAKIGVNAWSDNSPDTMRRILETRDAYLGGRIPGISPPNSEGNQTCRDERCAIWETIASSDNFEGRDGECFDSPRTGGRYFVSRRAEHSLANTQRFDKRFRARLSTWLVEERRLGNDCPEILGETLEKATTLRDLAVHARADRLLRFISNQTSNIGDYCEFSSPYICSMALAWSESTGMEQVEYLLRFLTNKGWLEEVIISQFEFAEEPNSSVLLRSYLVTVDGHARVAELEKKRTNSSQAFVAMWFDNSMKSAWENGMEPGVRDAGYEPRRIDEKHHANKIDDEIIAEIRRSRFVVADFTHGKKGARGGVYYEAGFALGLNIPVIFACRKDKLKKVHFDTRQYPHIVWEQPEELRQQLAKRISAVIGDGPIR